MEGEEEMGAVPKEVIERLVVLYIVESFERGVFGKVRLHKIAYFGLKDVDQKPLTFKSWKHGEFSPKIPTILEQLASMGYIAACPLDTGHHGNQYRPTSRAMLAYHSDILDRFSTTLRKSIDQSIEEYGYHKQDKLLQLAESDELYLETEYSESIIDSNLPDMVEIPGLSEEETEELGLSLDPAFVCAARDIVWALEKTDLDFDKVEEVEGPPKIHRT